MDYLHQEIEGKWQQWWEDNQTYKVDIDQSKPKYYVLDMFPYPSGAGLHVGHPLGYIASDIMARFKRMEGYNVLHPMGFDAFGLPAEQYAIQTGVHPAESTRENTQRYRTQLKRLGFNYDWTREVMTCDPEYYRWTQWIFLKLYDHWYDHKTQKATPITQLEAYFDQHGTDKLDASCNEVLNFSAASWKSMTPLEKQDVLMNFRLAYRKVSFVNWCEELGTVLANDEVKDGVSERGGFPVERKPMLQWSLRITAYAERLLSEMDDLDWSDAMKAMQRNWIGKSEGASIYFKVEGLNMPLEVFTTRPDTIFGVSFMVIAPEHDLMSILTTSDQQDEVRNYINSVKNRSDRDRLSDSKHVTGVFTGSFAIHPFTGERIPVWTADYVLNEYGTGAIMAVPAGDDRDFAFANKFGLPILEIIDRGASETSNRETKSGNLINSDFLNGMPIQAAIKASIQALENLGIGKRVVQYKLRDALFSRQRYWGEPFPIYYDKEGLVHTIKEEDLPVTLPPLDNFQPTSDGKSPLARATEWINFDTEFMRETDTMPGYAGSSWYFLRYMDSRNENEFASKEALTYWKDVDLYIGGTEHAVGHLMYSRFWHKFLYDIGKVPTFEPFKRLVNQGMIQGVIESLYIYKQRKDGRAHFICSKLVGEENKDSFTQIPVLIDYVKEYGSDNSYMDVDSIKQFMDWRPEFKDAIFECGNGIFENGQFFEKEVPSFNIFTHSEVGKMSKSKYNVINPDDVVAIYGADCFRMYEMFLGPVEQSKPWDTKGIDGVAKFLKRYWSLFYNEAGNWAVNSENPSREMLQILHQTIQKVRVDLERLSLNTCVSHFMICLNELRRLQCRHLSILEPLTILLAPFAPHITEEIWRKMGKENSVHHARYPEADPALLVSDQVTYPVSINGKKRAELSVPRTLAGQELETMALEIPEIVKWMEGLAVRKMIVVPGRMINIVAG
jgi:leucyl-tRNA synthetase